MQDGEYLTEMKIAKVIALCKKENDYKGNKYRPIDLLPCFNKLYEKLLSKRAIKFLDDNNLIFKFEFGFPKHNTCFNLFQWQRQMRSWWQQLWYQYICWSH